MKGVIVDYWEDRQFGFIKDENEERRFFHVSNIRDSNHFLENIIDYFFVDDEERICYVVEFTPNENERGLSAKNIKLTEQIFNDKLLSSAFSAKVIDVTYEVSSAIRTVSGIKQGMSAPFGATAGGNGTYRIGYPEVWKRLNVHFHRIDDIGWGKIEVRDLALKVNSRSKITDSFVETIKSSLVGKTVGITLIRNEWTLADQSILEI